MRPAVRPIFQTFLGDYDFSDMWGFEDFNEKLRAAVLAERERDPKGVAKSNQAGCWHSDLLFFQRSEDPACKQLVTMFRDAFQAYTKLYAIDKVESSMGLSPWVMIAPKGSWSAPHTHPNCQFAGCYYLDDIPQMEPPYERAGHIAFLDTRGTTGHQIKGLALQQDITVRPQKGHILVFPQWAHHYVHPVQGEDERISVACNATLTPTKSDYYGEKK